MLAPKLREAPIDMKVKVKRIFDIDVPKGYDNHFCDTAYVKDALEGEVDYWRYWSPIFIDAGTGKGKTSFIYEVLIPRALEQRRHVVLVSNRIACSIQQKRAILELLESPLRRQLTDQGVRETDIFGSVAVISYQSLPRFVNDPANKDWLDNVLYMVADECHYFTADCSFNRHCEYHLKLITKHFKRAIRIYMSATSFDVLQLLLDAENKIDYRAERFAGWRWERHFHRYHWKPDHSHVDLHFFQDLGEIKKLILGTTDKYLIFVDSKERGKEFARELGNRAIYLDADSKGSKEMEKLLKDNAFEAQVLVTTKILDCGVNILDNRLRDIVVVTDDRTSMLQMLGRKRCKPGERVNLRACDMDKRVLARRYRDGQELLAVLERYERSDEEERRRLGREIWNGDDDRLRLYFGLTDRTILPNRLAFYALRRKLYFYEKILNGRQTFRAAVCEWLGKTLEPEVVPADELAAFCEAHLGQELSGDEIATVRELIVKAAGATGFVEPQPTRVATLGRDALNNRMGKFNSPYRFEKNVWKILKEE